MSRIKDYYFDEICAMYNGDNEMPKSMTDQELIDNLPAARAHYQSMSDHLHDRENRDSYEYYSRLLHARDLLAVAKMKANEA